MSIISAPEEENPADKIIKIEDVDEKFRKMLGTDKIFRFECEKRGQYLRLGLTEINVFTPYYYEKYLTKSDFDNINPIFKVENNLDEIEETLNRLFEKRAILKNVDDGKKMIICFQMQLFDKDIETNFELDRKTIDNKDEGLLTLFNIQKKNIEIFNKIKEQCKKNKKEPVSQKILDLLSQIKIQN